jgi:hypothetical protein
MNKSFEKLAALSWFLRYMDHGVLRAYVHLCPFATQVNLTSPGLAVLAVLAILL